MMQIISSPISLIQKYSHIQKLTNSVDAIKLLKHDSYDRANTPLDGDKYFAWFYLEGNETKLEISVRKESDKGIFDLYINDVLDSSGYDLYAATGAAAYYEITLAHSVNIGSNKVEIRVNGKNVASSAYQMGIYGMNFQ